MAGDDDAVKARVPAPRGASSRIEVTYENLTEEWCLRAAREALRLESFLSENDPNAGSVDHNPIDQSGHGESALLDRN